MYEPNQLLEGEAVALTPTNVHDCSITGITAFTTRFSPSVLL